MPAALPSGSSSPAPRPRRLSRFQAISALLFVAACASAVFTSVHFVSEGSTGVWLHRMDPSLSVTVPAGVHLSVPQSVFNMRTSHFFSDFTFHSVQVSPQISRLQNIRCESSDRKELVFHDAEITHELAEAAVDHTRKLGSAEFIRSALVLHLHLFCSNATARHIFVGDIAALSRRLQEALQADADASNSGLRILSVFLPQPNLLLPVQQTWLQKLIEPTASLQLAMTSALAGIGYYFKDHIVAFLRAVFRRKVSEAMRRQSHVTVSSRDGKFSTVKRYLDEVCVKNMRHRDLRVYTPGKTAASTFEDYMKPRVENAVKQPEAVRFALKTDVWYRFQYAPYVMQNASKIKLWKKSRSDELQQLLQSCKNIAGRAVLPNSPARPPQTSMYDATKCNIVTETLNRSGLLDDARTLLEDIQSAYSDHDDNTNFPPPEYVAALLGSVNRALQAQQDHVTLLSRIWLKILSLFFMDNDNEFRYIVYTEDIAGKDGPMQLATLHIYTSGLDNAPLRAIVKDAMKWNFDQLPENKLRVFVTEEGGWRGCFWKKALDRKPRLQDSVVYEGELMTQLLDDVRNFFRPETVREYMEKGIPHRRGYLFHGPPGCGKTSFITVLASELNRDLAMIDVSSNGLDDKQFAQLLREAPDGCIIVLEDVDAMFQSEKGKESGSSNDKRNMQKGSKLTFSGLLNAIDGVASQEGCILIMTTNHPEKLDPAFVRPGRVDVMMEIKNASQDQLKKMFLRFYSGGEDAAFALQFSVGLPGEVISMAKLQGFFMKCQQNRLSAKECLDSSFSLIEDSDVKMDFSMQINIFAALWSIGLERYAPFFEERGVYTVEDFRKFRNDSEVLCLELELDPNANKLLSELSSADAKFFSCSLAKLQDEFHSSYNVTDHEGKRCIWSSGTKMPAGAVSPRCPPEECLSDQTFSIISHNLKIQEHVQPTELMTLQNLLECCSNLCKVIKQLNTPLGKGELSLHRVRLFFDSFPRRPSDALEHLKKSVGCGSDLPAAAAMFDLRSRTERAPHRLSLPDFLSRMAVPVKIRGQMLQNLLRNNVSTVDDFVRYVSSHKSSRPGPPRGGGGGDGGGDEEQAIVAKLCGQHCISVALAQRIINVCNKVPAACEKFAPVSASRVFEVFQGFYAASPACITPPDQVEKIAYEFSRALADARGVSRVSLFQLSSFLQEHDRFPANALHAVKSAGVEGIGMFTAQHELLPAPSCGAVMLRLGLERYAELFGKIGVTSLEDLKNCDIASVCKLSPEFALDYYARSALKQLSDDYDNCVVHKYASVDEDYCRRRLSLHCPFSPTVNTFAKFLCSANVSLHQLSSFLDMHRNKDCWTLTHGRKAATGGGAPVSATAAVETINYDHLNSFFCPTLQELKQSHPALTFDHVAKRLAIAPEIARVWEAKYSSLASMITKLGGDQSDAQGSGPPPPAPGGVRHASKAGGQLPSVAINPNAEESNPDAAVASKEQLDSREDLLQRLVDDRRLHEIDRQRFSLPPIRLVYDAFVAFYEELGMPADATKTLHADAYEFSMKLAHTLCCTHQQPPDTSSTPRRRAASRPAASSSDSSAFSASSGGIPAASTPAPAFGYRGSSLVSLNEVAVHLNQFPKSHRQAAEQCGKLLIASQ